MNEQEQLLATIAAAGVVGWWLASVLFVAWRCAGDRANYFQNEADLNHTRWQGCKNDEIIDWRRNSDQHLRHAETVRDRYIGQLENQVESLQRALLPSDPEKDA